MAVRGEIDPSKGVEQLLVNSNANVNAHKVNIPEMLSGEVVGGIRYVTCFILIALLLYCFIDLLIELLVMFRGLYLYVIVIISPVEGSC